MTNPVAARADALARRKSALSSYEGAIAKMLETVRYTEEERAAQAEAARHMDAILAAEAAYFEAIPRTPVSCCPYCAEPLVRTFDPYGLEGFWWRSSAEPEEPRACRHFCLLRGAVDLAGEPPDGGDFEAHVGPAVPYVIPRILELPGMIAVVSRIRTADRHLAYPVAYFAERRPPPQDLTAGWARTNYVYMTQLGEVRWRVPNDPWDFELRPWLERGKLRWCTSNGQTFVLSPESEAFPYLDLPGERRPQVVKGNALFFEPQPDGSILREPPLLLPPDA